ncbi:MAG: hypothetical protein ACI80K_001009 [Paracoccaceae bacterium]|jgi:hypothetical protein
MEGGLLSSNDLAPLYDSAAWMYLFQDFSGSEADRRAERVAIRFGITAWPQHFLIDPTDLSVIGSTGRALDTFQQAFESAPKISGASSPTSEDLAAYDVLADRIQTANTTDLAKESLGHEDIVVRYCAVASLAEHEPTAVAQASGDLLSVEHDQLRFLVCQVLLKQPNPAVAPALEALLTNPSGSKNPNRLRCEVAKALGTSGGPSSLEILSTFGIGGSPNNSLTRYSLESVAAIARREASEDRGAAWKKAQEILVASFPVPPKGLPPGRELGDGPGDKVAQRQARSTARITHLARLVHELLEEQTGKTLPFPATYDAATRAALIARWSE